MKDRIKSAFDVIHAEDSLKAVTLLHLYGKMQKKARPRRFLQAGRLIAAACLLFAVLAGGFSYNIYFTEAAYVDLDINPSVELTVNRFDRVIGVSAYNADGEVLLSGIKLQHKKVDVALGEIIEAAAQAGTLQNEGLVSVTVQALSGDETALLTGIQSEVAATVSHHGAVEVDVFSVDGEIREAAHEQCISPAKYLAIMELQEVDPTASIEGCRDHTIGEIRQRTQEHGEGHHRKDDSNGIPNEDIRADDSDDTEDTGTPSHHVGHGAS